MEWQYVVHRFTGTVHVCPVEADRSVRRTSCGRELDDLKSDSTWLPISREDVTCLTCSKALAGAHSEVPWADPDSAIGYALMETEHLPGFARRGPAFRLRLAEAGWKVVRA